MLPLPSRTHPQKQTPVVYTEELTHLVEAERVVQGSLQKSLFGEASVAVSL